VPVTLKQLASSTSDSFSVSLTVSDAVADFDPSDEDTSVHALGMLWHRIGNHERDHVYLVTVNAILYVE